MSLRQKEIASSLGYSEQNCNEILNIYLGLGIKPTGGKRREGSWPERQSYIRLVPGHQVTPAQDRLTGWCGGRHTYRV